MRKSQRQELISKSGSGRNDTETEAINQAIVDSAQQTTKSPRPSYNCPTNRPNRGLKEASASSEDPVITNNRITVVRLTEKESAASCVTRIQEGSMHMSSTHRVACDNVTDVTTD